MESVTVAEIERRYPDEWVVVEITRDHKDHLRVVGHLLAHSRERADLDEAYRRFRAEHPHARLYEFYTGDLVGGDAVIIL